MHAKAILRPAYPLSFRSRDNSIAYHSAAYHSRAYANARGDNVGYDNAAYHSAAYDSRAYDRAGYNSKAYNHGWDDSVAQRRIPPRGVLGAGRGTGPSTGILARSRGCPGRGIAPSAGWKDFLKKLCPAPCGGAAQSPFPPC